MWWVKGHTHTNTYIINFLTISFMHVNINFYQTPKQVYMDKYLHVHIQHTHTHLEGGTFIPQYIVPFLPL